MVYFGCPPRSEEPAPPLIYDRAAVLQALGEVTFAAGDTNEALKYAREGQAIYAGLNAPGYVAQAQINVAAYSLVLGNIDDARDAARGALTAAQRTGDPMIAAAAFQHLAGVAAARGDLHRAAKLLGVSDGLRATAPARLFTEQSGYERTMKMLHAVFADEALYALVAEGRRWMLDDAFEQALAVA